MGDFICVSYALISHASKVMLKILQARLQQYMNRELPDVQAGFKKGRGTRNQVANICWIIEKARNFQKNICFIVYAKPFDCVDHNKLWKILKKMGILRESFPRQVDKKSMGPQGERGLEFSKRKDKVFSSIFLRII